MKIFSYIDRIFQLAGSLIGPPIVGILLGQFLDNKFNAAPIFTIVLLILGLITGLRSLFSLVKNIDIK